MRSMAMAVVLGLVLPALGQEAIRTLLLTGQQNHNWRYTSRFHEETLEATGRFEVDVTDDPGAVLADAGVLARYQLFVMDYNGARWGEAAERNFAERIADGAGLVIIHASNNPFQGWEAFERMCGLLWRQGAGHGAFHAFDVEYVDAAHPITRGLPGMKSHPDELYHSLANPQGVKYHLLARAMSTTESGGTGKHEPMALTLEFGLGRVFHTPLGHVWEGEQDQKASIADPQFRTLLCRGAEWAATGSVTIRQWRDSRRHNALSEAERNAGWVSLFDGAGTGAWRGYRKAAFPGAGWVIEDQCLNVQKGGGGGDIVTEESFKDFEFECEWRAAPGANSGIMYRVDEAHDYPWRSGPEMQVLDNAAHADGKDPKTSAGSLYALVACAHDVVRPAGEFNRARVAVKGNHVEHWLNGFKVLEYELGSPEFAAMVGASKFKDMPHFGRSPEGRISLQDHGDDVWFRNLRVRRLD